MAEQAAYGDQLADLEDLLETTTWPGTPSVVLTAGHRAGWVRKQRVLAHRLGARQVVVDDSRHLMMVDRPDAVAEAVLGLLPEGSADALAQARWRKPGDSARGSPRLQPRLRRHLPG